MIKLQLFLKTILNKGVELLFSFSLFLTDRNLLHLCEFFS